MTTNKKTLSKERIIGFLWQHFMLLISLTIMTLGVALCVRSDLGSSVISSCPLAFTIAGQENMVPSLSLGTYTNILNILLVVGQVIVLRRKFQPIQLLQLVIGIVFGALIDMNMALTANIIPANLTHKIITQLAGCTVMAIGIAFEVRCGSITMPGEGLPIAISRVTGRPFARVKIFIDITLVVLAVTSCYIFFGEWKWNVVGVGTLLAMIYVGMAVKFASNHIAWFDRLLGYRPGFRRYLYGLARYIRRN
ncbi:MAG: hypothetical protein K2K88_01470 [Muribaculaceae bacterium]|nr:hypothetical protein [Muribaculaceae bacterium]MDE6644313.1 hypothetical protein [Muribaculaceae bacterium]